MVVRDLILGFAGYASLFLTPSLAIADSPPCAGADLATAQKAMVVAKGSLISAISALESFDNDKLDRAATWLGVHSSKDAEAARDVLRRAVTLASNPTFVCDNSTYNSLGDVYAHVRSTDPFVIKLGYFFFRAPERGFDSKPGALVHEMTHFSLVGGAQDLANDLGSSKALAASNPTAARRNANNYEYFVESVAFGL